MTAATLTVATMAKPSAPDFTPCRQKSQAILGELSAKMREHHDTHWSPGACNQSVDLSGYMATVNLITDEYDAPLAELNRNCAADGHTHSAYRFFPGSVHDILEQDSCK